MMASLAPAFGLADRFREWRDDFAFSERAKRLAALAGLLAFGGVWGVAVGMGGVATAIVAATFIACAFVMRDFRAGVVLLIAIMPISQSYVFPHEMFGITGMNPLNLVMATTLSIMVMRIAGTGTLWHIAPKSLVWLYLAPLVFAGLIGAPHAKDIPGVFQEQELIFFTNAVGYLRDMLIKPAQFVVYALMIAVAVQRSQKPERFVTPVVFSVWIMACVVLVFTALAGVSISDLAGEYSRSFFSALGMHANDLGRLYAVAYALLLFVWDRTDHIGVKTVMFFAMGVVVLALLLTFSRGAFSGFILVNIIYLISRRSTKTLLLAVVLIPIGLYLTPGAVWDRVTFGFDGGAEAVSNGRMEEIWKPVIPELFKSPLWGNGLGAIMWSAPMQAGVLPQVSHPHNAYLEILLDVGIIGAILVIAFWIVTWRDFRRLAHDQRLAPELQGFFEGAAAGLLAFLMAGAAGSSLLPAPEQAFLWLAVGMMYGIRRKFAPRPVKKKRRF
jgi:O-antigen ligase